MNSLTELQIHFAMKQNDQSIKILMWNFKCVKLHAKIKFSQAYYNYL